MLALPPAVLWGGGMAPWVSGDRLRRSVWRLAAVAFLFLCLPVLPAHSLARDPDNPVPSISALTPSSATVGSGAFALTVDGAGFVPGAYVQWNGSGRQTSVLSSTQLQALIADSDLAVAGPVSVTVLNPGPGGGVSNAVTFTVIGNAKGLVAAQGVGALPGSVALVPVTLVLNSGVSIDRLSFGLAVNDSGLPPLTGSLSFQTGPSMPSPNMVDSGGVSNAIAVSWYQQMASPLSGTVYLGDVKVSVPAGATYAQTYALRVTMASGNLGTTGVVLAPGADAALTVTGSAYLVGDVFPLISAVGDQNGDGSYLEGGEFGDGGINILDLLWALRAVTNIPGFRPAACTDRFDAIDSYPADTASTRGGDGALTILDLVTTLRRATGVDSNRPRRVPRGLCPSGTQLQAMGWREPAAEPEADSDSGSDPAADRRDGRGSIEVGEPERVAGRALRLPVYFRPRAGQAAGLAFSLGLEGGSDARLRFIPRPGVFPSLCDDSLPGILALVWLYPISATAGHPLQLGWVELAAGNWAGSAPRFALYGISTDVLPSEAGP